LAKEDFIQELTDLVSGYLSAKGLEFIELIHRFESKRLVLTVLADKPQGGITLEECALLCRQLKDLLEGNNVIEGDYVLEVSSPGLDRPLKSQKDFLRSLNKEAVFYLNDLVNGKCQWQGIICKAEEAVVLVQVAGEILEIPLIKINKVQLVI
jgi:ribosome maturation factor RimP